MLLAMRRRPLLLSLTAASGAWPLWAASLSRRNLVFPADHGAHPQQQIEWWYVTGHLTSKPVADPTPVDPGAQPHYGFQVTFFRSRTSVDPRHPSRFAASQLLFAHAALTDLRGKRLLHDQRISRTGFGLAEFDASDTRLTLKDWALTRSAGAGPAGSRYSAQVRCPGPGFAFNLQFETTQAVLLQGDDGWSRKGPQPAQASQYYSQPQLTAAGTVTLGDRAQIVSGRAWLDHEWSDALLDAQAVGWDWIGMNLHDGSALTAFRLRRADGSALYAGGSLRRSGGRPRNYAASEVQFKPMRVWASPHSAARYPVRWQVDTPDGRFEVATLLDDQELDSRSSTGAIYWEGLSELLDATGQRIGLGYLEMTGYASALRL